MPAIPDQLVDEPEMSSIEPRQNSLTPQSANKISQMASDLVNFMDEASQATNASSNIGSQRKMLVDEEVSIQSHGNKVRIVTGASQASLGEEVYYSCPESQSLVTLDDPEMLSGSLEKMDERRDEDERISKESIPEHLMQVDEIVKPDTDKLVETTPIRRRSLTNNQDVIEQEFDPMGLIAFESPSRFPQSKMLKTTVSTPIGQACTSLLDMEMIQTSPGSIPKYTQREFDALKGEFERRAERQVEFLQFEVQTIQEKYDGSVKANGELKLLLSEYERTMSQILEARKHKSDHLATIEQLLQDKRQLEVDLQTAHISYENLHTRYDEVKALNEQLRVHEQALKANIGSLQAELANSDRRFDALRQHAESKMSEANNQLQRIQSTMEVEISAMKAKLLKAELRIGSLEEALEGKTRENKELGAICDELIQKIDAANKVGGQGDMQPLKMMET